ncbi:hypothetical protein WM43_01815 [Aeromonas veronii]|uniref:Uncharacterized protein n=1 Tax=Aeromonas veronii TaxID=654 RepID=A0AAC9B4R2_AERVE|nr:hypothetical protein WM43_01815 [Aeromonas veronii]
MVSRLYGFVGRLLFVKQDVGTLPVEIFKLLGANGPEEDDPGDDHKQDSDGDQDKNYIHEGTLAFILGKRPLW